MKLKFLTYLIVICMISCADNTAKTELMSELPVLGIPNQEGKEHTIKEFEFKNVLGGTLASSDLKGQVYLTEFFYSSCPSVCPKVGEQMIKVYEELKDKEGFSMLSITLDSEYDDAEKLKEHIAKIGFVQKPKNWFFLRGDKEETYKLARESFYTPIKELLNTDREIIHDGVLVLVDGQGHIRGMYDGMDAGSVLKIKNDVKFLLTNTSEQKI